MKKYLFALMALCYFTLQAQNEVRLLVRGDDIGSFHAANLACIDSYKNGVMRSVEIMACCPWFPEAVRMLNENPGLDVGVHLMITSEWSGCKWRPLTSAPSLVDTDGNFYPFIWPIQGQPGIAIQDHDWKLDEIEKEFRAQIELVKKYLPRTSHISTHMGCANWNPEVEAMTKRIAKEYGLDVETGNADIKRFPKFEQPGMNNKQRIDAFAKAIENLEPGTYIYVEHPAYNTPEMKGVNHVGNYDVAEARQLVADMFQSPKVKKAVEKRNVKLISYSDLK
ncbi:MAG: ChbG/HpnK family deacetylase [Bacteroidales bacterium]|nr:ChbG/HpnK family deacetylase [Bacteroidales bacterium]